MNESYYPALTTAAAPPSAAWIQSQYRLLTTIFSQRNSEYSSLRRVFDGDMAGAQEAKTKTGTPFQDRMSLIYNVSNATVRRYMDSMSSPPRIECIPEGFDLADLELADKRTKFLEYIYHCNNMPMKLMQVAYYQSLLDKAILHARPAPNLPHKIKIELGVPDFYYPITRGDDWQHPVAVIYGFRTFRGNNFIRDPMTFRNSEELEGVIEFWDENWFIRIEPEKVLVIKHMLGLIPWYEVHNLPIPHRYRGQGDVDQAVGLNEYLNMLMSAMGEMIAYAAAPIAIVRGTKVGGTNLPFEPRAVWELERDAQAGFLQWSGAPPSVEAQILRTIQAIEDTTGVSSPAFGREIPSGTSGSAVRSLMAGFNTRLGTKQQMLGEALTRLNEGIQCIAEKMFPSWEYRVVGENIQPGRDMGKHKIYGVQPKDFKGWYRNRVLFSPLDPSQTYFQEVDKWQKGLQSRYTTMKSLGVQNVWDELERMRLEHGEKAEQENDMAQARNGQFVAPAKAEEDQAAMTAMLSQILGGENKAIEQKAAKEKVASDAARQSATGQVAPAVDTTAPQEPAKASSVAVPMADVLSALRKLTTLSGRGALVGSPQQPAIALENPQDENTIRQALGSLGQGIKFTKLKPDEVLSSEAIEFSPQKGQKKNQVEIKRLNETYLSLVVLNTDRTNNALVYNLGIQDDNGNIIPIAKSDPQRRITAEDGEIIRVRVSGLSLRDDSGVRKWGIISPMPVASKVAPSRPSSFKDLQRLWDGKS